MAAITNAGGFGVYGATRRLPEEIEAELAEIRRLTGDKPFGVDLVIPAVIPEENDRAAMEAQILTGRHRAFAGSWRISTRCRRPLARACAPASCARTRSPNCRCRP
ncbi:MAG: nitronate monooxygenase [Burkholderiaceae bacterium]